MQRLPGHQKVERGRPLGWREGSFGPRLAWLKFTFSVEPCGVGALQLPVAARTVERWGVARLALTSRRRGMPGRAHHPYFFSASTMSCSRADWSPVV